MWAGRWESRSSPYSWAAGSSHTRRCWYTQRSWSREPSSRACRGCRRSRSSQCRRCCCTCCRCCNPVPARAEHCRGRAEEAKRGLHLSTLTGSAVCAGHKAGGEGTRRAVAVSWQEDLEDSCRVSARGCCGQCSHATPASPAQHQRRHQEGQCGCWSSHVVGGAAATFFVLQRCRGSVAGRSQEVRVERV